MRRISTKRREEMKEYVNRKARYFRALARKQEKAGLSPEPGVPWCEICVKEGWKLRPALDWHHVLPKGRGGKQNQEEMMAVSRFAHSYIHNHPSWAEEHGYLLKPRPDFSIG